MGTEKNGGEGTRNRGKEAESSEYVEPTYAADA